MSQTTTSKLSETPPNLALQKRRRLDSQGFFAASFSRFFRDPLSVIALVIFVIITIISFSAPLIADNILHQKRDTIDFDLLAQGFQPPVPPGTAGHSLGTDELGRDMAMRLIYGGQVSLSVGFLTAFISIFMGTTLGLLAGFFGGIIDDLVNALVQIILNIPSLFLLIILSLIWKPDVISLSFIIGVISWVGATRIVRGSVLSLRNLDYVDAARVVGANNFRIILVHILPNVVSLMLVQAGFDVVGAMLSEAGLSYLGFGISVPIPSWGNMLTDSQLYFTSAPWMVYLPSVAIFITILCVYLAADGLRDAFDPRLKGR
ncbi:MAG: ABC transporter permease [Chloroflexi bacterium]|uniref:ABC transporter permease n=1 Tax=Candidatus Chlorohelix allophototropha TaxID=3003348 RepID=A0A8T7LZ73_9CHLR|nr:ABC transporter permease [Chloroflexota bacterium]WJW66148.1 ABC transporter permease [Chloroflexota bacterium L227-S17]